MIFIPGNVPSSKNGRIFVRGRSVASASCQKYYKASKEFWESKENKKKFIVMCKGKLAPFKVQFHFIRNSKRRFDYINPAQTVQDLMVKYKWIEDDNSNYLIPVFKEFGYDKEKAGVYIEVL